MAAELVYFIGITYLLSWSSWLILIWSGQIHQPLFWLAGFGPSLAALLVTAVRRGWKGIDKLVFPRLKVKAGWYLFSLLGTPLIMLSALLLHILLGGELPRYLDSLHPVTSLEQWPGVIIVFLYILVFSGLGEEIGWRGFCLPRLLGVTSPILASLVLGLIWAAWHLPLFWLPGTVQSQLPLSWFLLQILGATILYTWIYLKTKGSLLAAILFHTSGNASLGLLPMMPLDNGGSLRPLWLTLLLLWMIAGLTLYLERDLFFDNVHSYLEGS